VESLAADHPWLVGEGFKHVVSNLHHSVEYLGALVVVQRAAHALGLFVGLKSGYRYCSKGWSIESVTYYRPDAESKFNGAVGVFEAKQYRYLTNLADFAD
jgi:hypothetical protein